MAIEMLGPIHVTNQNDFTYVAELSDDLLLSEIKGLLFKMEWDKAAPLVMEATLRGLPVTEMLQTYVGRDRGLQRGHVADDIVVLFA